MRQLLSISLGNPEGLEVLSVREPSQPGDSLVAEVSLDCSGIEQSEGGITIRERERFDLYVAASFPFDAPSTWVRHTRWAGTPHVQWRSYLCLYQAPMVEWLPADGMYSYIERLFHWLERAAANTLDPVGGPLHPPVAYVKAGAPMVIPRVDAPRVDDGPWLGSGQLVHSHERRYDLIGWQPEHDANGKLNTPADGAAAVVLLDQPLDWEYPSSVAGLLIALSRHGVPLGRLIVHLGFVAAFRGDSAPLMVVVGAPMRRTAEGEARQHLTAWRIADEDAQKLRLALHHGSADESKREIGKQAIGQVIKWAGSADAEWCSVYEARPEVVERRDSQSPVQAFAGKTVAVWGCGALGGPLAEWVVRAGAKRVLLYDRAAVTPGILIRQPYRDRDIGKAKCVALRQRLAQIDPAVEVEDRVVDVLTGPLEREDWHDGADIVIDATASVSVQAKLERMRRLQPQPTAIITALIGHTAEDGLAVLAQPAHSGGGADVLRQTKLACSRLPHLRAYREEFWPTTPRQDLFQPEPGCSSPTFRGSAAEVAALAGTLMVGVAADLVPPTPEATATAHLAALPSRANEGPRAVRLEWSAAICLPGAGAQFEVRVAPAAAAAMRGWIASARRRLPRDSETGGIIFGQRDNAVGVIWVDEVSGPPPDSHETPELFVCGTAGVAAMRDAKLARSGGSLDYLGIWHTHPAQSPDFSMRDLQGMGELLTASSSPRAEGLILIAGWANTEPLLAAYMFEREQMQRHQATITCHQPEPLPAVSSVEPHRVGLALSGGGSRAIAFHLGCLRALHDRGVLDQVQVVSGVSGGSVMSALWAYSNDDFDRFEARVVQLLRRGLAGSIAHHALLSRRAPQALASRVLATAGAGAARGANLVRRVNRADSGPPMLPPWRRRVSRTDAFADALAARVCGDLKIDAPRRGDIGVVINACDLASGSAFRFGSRESGSWQAGTVVGNDVDLATAVAASAAYPLLLPALDRQWEFQRRNGERHQRRVVLTDGGIFDNLGTSCLEPGRDATFSTNVYPVDYVIACDAGRGQLAPAAPVGFLPRMSRSFESTFRKVQDGARGRLHSAVAKGELEGFVMPYLGQQDRSLPERPAGLVPREAVVSYPTNFSPMSAEDLVLISGRGEQLTRLLLEAYSPEL